MLVHNILKRKEFVAIKKSYTGMFSVLFLFVGYYLLSAN